MSTLTFRNSKIIYYGPHECENCNALICRMGEEFGHNSFTYPEGPIYPNTEWFPHVCDPKLVQIKERKLRLIKSVEDLEARNAANKLRIVDLKGRIDQLL